MLQCAHIVSRRYTATRWERGNAVCLCRACHMRYTANPLAWDLWVEEEIGIPAYIALKQKALAGRGRTDYKALLSDLRQRWKETSGE